MADIALHPDVADALREVQKKETLENIINFINKVIEKKEKCCSELVLEYGIKIMSEHEGEINKIGKSIIENITWNKLVGQISRLFKCFQIWFIWKRGR